MCLFVVGGCTQPPPTPVPTPTPTVTVDRADLPGYLAIVADHAEPWQARAAAARAAGEVMAATGPDDAAVTVLTAVLGEEYAAPEWFLYRSAAGALGSAGPAAREAVPYLIPLLGAKYHAPIQETVMEALQAITGENYGTDIARWQRWWDEQP
jgi:hypothetical protein